MLPKSLFNDIVSKHARLVYKQGENFVEIPMQLEEVTTTSEFNEFYANNFIHSVEFPQNIAVNFTGILSNDDLMRIYTPESKHTSLIPDDEWDQIMSKIREEI